MLPEELERANEEAKRQRRLIIVSSLAIVSLGLLVLLMADWLTSSATEVEKIPTIVQSPTQPLVQVVDTPGSNPADREKFKQALKIFESDIEARLAVANLPAWSPAVYKDIYVLKDQALSAFGRSEYALALDALGKSQTLAEKTLANWQDQYDAAFSAARDAFDANDADRAKLHIERALILKPTDAAALSLRQRIVVLPRIQGLLAAVKVAKVENNLAGELEILKKLLGLDPLRIELKARITYLQKELAETNFAAAIDSGLKAVETHDMPQARAALAEAKALFPARRAVRILSDKISKHAQANSLVAAVKKSNQAAANDDWLAVLEISRAALQANPANKDLINKAQSAKKIIALDNAMTGFLKRHQRLASGNIALRAEKTLQDVNAVSHLSKGLAQKAAKLREALSQYSSPVEVTVRSDNQTYISIRGVGNIGLTTSKRIKLKPGKYTFEGKRSGFKAKLRTLVIGRNQKTVSIEVISDERI